MWEYANETQNCEQKEAPLLTGKKYWAYTIVSQPFCGNTHP